jgi:LPS export ABC transporter protein LptC
MNYKMILKIFSLFFIALVILFISSCEEKLKPNIVTDTRTSEIPTQESWNSAITISDSGRVTAVVKTGHVSFFNNKAEYILEEGVKVDFFNKHGEHSSVLTSERATIDDRTKNMEASGNVKVVSDSGTVVKTEKMKWLNNLRKITGDQFVTITSPKETIQGYGFESDQNLKDYTIKRVSGQMTSDNINKK